MKTRQLPWDVAKNRLATGVVKEVKYNTGIIASYKITAGKVCTYYNGKFHSYREPCNPHYLFKVTS